MKEGRRLAKAGYWKACLKWVTLRGRQRAIVLNPGNALKRRYVLNFISNCLKNYVKSRAEEMFLILDVGSGLGDIALDFFSKGMRAEYVLLDMDKDALLESKATLASFDTEFVLADAQKLPFRRRVFDLIICSEVLEHLPDDARALREMSEVLFKHGAMIITVPLYEDLDLGKMYGHLRSYTINSFLRLCSVENLDVRRYLLACKTIHAIRKMALKLFGRRGWENEKAPYIHVLPSSSSFSRPSYTASTIYLQLNVLPFLIV